MEITINYDRPAEGPRSGPVTVGWLRSTDKHAVLYDPPERVSFRDTAKVHPKSASRCPAVIQMESRFFMVRCPFDMHLGFSRDPKGKPVFVNRAGQGSAVRPNKLNELLVMVNEAEWRYPDRPTMQLILPYLFIADEPVWITQLDAFMHYRREPLPGTIFGGRFPISVWPRPLMWAFEWHDISKDIVLKRGDPLFYVQFEAEGPDRPVQLVEAEKTAELSAYLEAIGGAVNYVNQSFSLFRAAEALRPKSLLVPKKRD